MNQEKEWYEEEPFQQEMNGNCSREECWHIYSDVPAIIAEATRRAKLESWEEVARLVDNQMCNLNDGEITNKEAHFNMNQHTNSRIQQYGTKE